MYSTMHFDNEMWIKCSLMHLPSRVLGRPLEMCEKWFLCTVTWLQFSEIEAVVGIMGPLSLLA